MAMVAGSIATYMHITKTLCVATCHLYNYIMYRSILCTHIYVRSHQICLNLALLSHCCNSCSRKITGHCVACRHGIIY